VGLGAIFLGMLAWAYVSVWIPTADLPNSNFQSAALQMLSGGVLLLVISVFTGDIARFDWTQVSERSIRSFIYLILGGSILAFTSFNYLLKNVATEKVVTNTYVNPVVALFLGWWLNHEQVSSQSVFASVLLLGGVVLINTKINWKWDWR
ncbi:MAG: EamA family transporter, partial [Saprospiraceae bacterium]|nr:EamA family transporter [Saprospiraceae bacterium]